MISVVAKGSAASFGYISSSDARWLRKQLECDSPDATTFFMDSATVDALASSSASAELLDVLRGALRSHKGLEIELVGRPSDEEVNRVADTGEAGQVDVNGRPLNCVVCKCITFEHRRAQLHSAAATFFNVEWLGRTADCYVCTECGYVHWFLR